MNAYSRHWCNENGFEKLNCSWFELDNVFYVGKLDSTTGALLRYMQKKYHALGIAEVEKIDGLNDVGVYHFVYPYNMEQYDSFWDVIDGV